MNGFRTLLIGLAAALALLSGCGSDDPPGDDAGEDAGEDAAESDAGEDATEGEAPRFTSTAVTAAQVGVPYVYDASASGDPAPTFELVEGPSWLSADEDGHVSGTPDEVGEFDVRLRASNANGAADQTFTIDVTEGGDGGVDGGDGGDAGALVITSSDELNGVENEALSFTLTAEPAEGVTWSSSPLPDGLTLDADTGEISGTPTETGEFVVIVTATSDVGVAEQVLDVRIAAADAPPTITSEPPASLLVRVGTTFTYTAAALSAFNPVTWSLVDPTTDCAIAPPPTIDEDTGTLTFSPSASGSCTVRIRATNEIGSTAPAPMTPSDQEFVLVAGDVPTVTPVDDVAIVDGDTVEVTLVATPAADATFELVSGPAAATIDAMSGELSWTSPATSPPGTDTFSFEVRATNAFGAGAVETFTVSVADLIPPSPPTITSSPTSTTVVTGERFEYLATATGSPLPLTWSLTGAPGGLSATQSPNGLSATIVWPAAGAPGAYLFELSVDNDGAGPNEPDVQEIELIVYAVPPTPAIDLVTNAPPVATLVDQPYSYDVALTAATDRALDGTPPAPITWSLDSGPTGATIDATTGVVSFTPTATGTVTYVVRATRTDYAASGTATINVRVDPQPAAPMFTTTPGMIPDLIAGVGSFPPYSPAASGVPGFPPGTITASALPPFLTFDGVAPADCPTQSFTAGTLAGCSPIASNRFGTYSVTLTATNSVGSVTQTITFRVIAPPATIRSVTPAAGRRQIDVPITIRGLSFSTIGALTNVRLRRGGSLVNATSVSVVDAQTVQATIPADVTRTPGVYDVVIVQSGVDYVLPRRFNVTGGGDGTVVTGNITFDQTWAASGSPYRVTGNVSVTNGAALTIEPGTTVMFGGPGTETNNLRLEVGVGGGGTVIADGGAPGIGDQIVFTAYQPLSGAITAGSYAGLRFGANAGGSTALRNVVVERAGRNNAGSIEGAVVLQDSAGAPSILDTIIRDSQRFGLYLGQDAGSETSTRLDRISLHRVGDVSNAILSSAADSVTALGPNLDLDDNVDSEILVRGGSVDRGDASSNAFFRHYAGVAYRTTGTISVLSGVTLRIGAGNTVRFSANASLDIGGASAGGLAIEAASDAVTLTSASATAGQEWRGVIFRAPATASVMRGVTISDFDNDLEGGVRLLDPTPGNTVVPPVVTIDQCTLTTTVAATRGIYLDNNARPAGVSGTTIDVTAESVNARADDVHSAMASSNSYASRVRVRGGTIDVSRNPIATTRWPSLTGTGGTSAPIELSGNVSIVNTSLEISGPNAIELGNGIELGTDPGRLFVNGSSGSPVVFRAAPAVAAWHRISLGGDLGTSRSEIRFAEIEDGGGGAAAPEAEGNASIRVFCSGSSCGTPIITGTTVSGSNGYGVSFADGAHAGGAFTGNVIDNARFAGLRVHANELGSIGTGNHYTDNDRSGSALNHGVRVVSGVVDHSATWPALDPADTEPFYSIDGDVDVRTLIGAPKAVLTIAPGAQLRFATGAVLDIGEATGAYTQGGELIANGTVAQPIRFTHLTDTGSAAWGGIFFRPPSTNESHISNATIAFGGQTGDRGNVNVLVSAGVGGAPVLDNVALTGSPRYAAVVLGSITAGTQPAFTNMTYSANTAGNCVLQAYGARTCVPAPSYP